MENSKLQFKRKNIERGKPTFDLTPVDAKLSETKPPPVDSPSGK